MLCKKCGAELPDGTEKCIFCGALLNAEDAAAEEEAQAQTETEAIEDDETMDENERNRREQIEKMLAEKKQQLSEIEERRNIKKKKQQRNRILIAALIIVLISVGAGVGIYYWKNKAKDIPIVDIPSPTPTISALPTATPEITPSPEPSEEPSASEEPISTEKPEAVGIPSENAQQGGQSWKSADGNTAAGANGNSQKSASNGNAAAKATAAPVKEKPQAVSTPVPKSTGITSAPINSRLAVGGEVMQYNGRWFMTFTSDGTLYYANVSPGSTTAQIAGKYMTISAVPTGDIHYGNTIYEITSMKKYASSEFIISDSDRRILTEADLSGLTKSELGIARNEIYARHGRKFKLAEYNNYFSKCSWYSINPNYNYSDDDSNLNAVERRNAAFILKVENSR